MINIDDFKKIEIKIGKVISAEKIPEGNKLLKLVFDFGGETRQIMSGIAESFPDPSVLVGKEMPILTNLETRKLLGYDSEGMLLAINVDGKAVLFHPATEVPPGSDIR
jgi:methionine--tRNA ligase beta chain